MPNVQTPDGKIIEFPDTMKTEEINAVLDKQYGNKTKNPEMSSLEKFGVGVGYGMKQAAQGAFQAVLEGGEYIRGKLGMKSNKENIEKLNKTIREDKEAFSKLSEESTAAKAGEIVGGTIPAMALPGGAAKGIISKAATAAGQGAVIGGLQPIIEGESRGSNIVTGAATGAGVSGALSAVKPLTKLAGRVSKETLGMTTGAGTGAIDEALVGGEAFKKALRGKLTGEEVVENARSALSKIKEKRAAEYQGHLANISGVNQPGAVAAEIDISPIAQKLGDQLKNYNIKTSINPKTGKLSFDTSRVAMGRSGINDIKGVISELQHWGSQPGDKTAIGLDILKRRLDDFYSDSSQARQFVASLKEEVSNTIKKSVPEYAEMTKGYAEATRLIKDIESGLMMRKQGMSGRVTADQTLRRLTSSMKENFELRKDLVDALGREGAEDISGQVAGYAMNQIWPKGVIRQVGAVGAGQALIYLNPKMMPLLAASSPRVVGEFLLAFGKAKELVKKSTPPEKVLTVARSMAQKAAAVAATQQDNKQKMNKWKEIGE